MIPSTRNIQTISLSKFWKKYEYMKNKYSIVPDISSVKSKSNVPKIPTCLQYVTSGMIGTSSESPSSPDGSLLSVFLSFSILSGFSITDNFFSPLLFEIIFFSSSPSIVVCVSEVPKVERTLSHGHRWSFGMIVHTSYKLIAHSFILLLHYISSSSYYYYFIFYY